MTHKSHQGEGSGKECGVDLGRSGGNNGSVPEGRSMSDFKLPETQYALSAEDGQDFPLIIATMPATARQRAIAVGIIIVLTVAAAAIAPFANIQLPQVNAFIPVLQTGVSVADLVTAILLFAQFSITSQPALLALASGYIFSGSFAFLQTLAFPGAYAPLV
jgi:hypothetical protein